MKNSDDLQAVVGLVRQHGYRHVIRAASYLWGVTKFIEAHDGRAPASHVELAKWWREPLRTTEREHQAWRKVTGNADAAARARRVLAEVNDVSVARSSKGGDAERLRLAPYLV